MRWAIIFVVFKLVLCRKNGLDNFISKRKIDNYQITILNYDYLNEVNQTWIEYQYHFQENENNETWSSENETLTVYFPVSIHQFDCGDEDTAYTQAILNILHDYDALMYDTGENSSSPDLIVCHGLVNNYATMQDDYNPLYQTFKSRFALIYKKQDKPKDIFVQTFVGTLWLCFLVILLALAICLSISTYYYSRIYKGNRRWSRVEITLWAIAAACQQGFSYTPSRISSRIFFFLGYLTAYVLYTGFTAAITSVLVQQETVAINVNDYNVIGYGVTGNSIGQYKIASHGNDLLEFFKKIDADVKVHIGIGPQVLLEQYIIFNGLDINEYNIMPLMVDGEYKRNFWLKKSLTEYEKKINYRLIKLSETGILKALLTKSLRHVIRLETVNNEYSSASLEHVKSAILLFLGGVAASLVFLMMELGVYGYRHRVTEQT